MSPLSRPQEYLEVVAAGIKIAEPRELPEILREIARNLEVLANEAEFHIAAWMPNDTDQP